MKHDYSVRSLESEIMDDFDMSGDLLLESIDQIAIINRILGGNLITKHGIQHFATLANRPLKILDIGCGGGHMCREMSDWAKKKGYDLTFVGIDANQAAIEYSKQRSSDYPNISYQVVNIHDPSFDFSEFDIALATLTLHHFSNEEIVSLLNRMKESIQVGIVINDLHRDKLAYKLYQVFCKLLRINEMVASDGSISIRSGFTRKELLDLSVQLKLKEYSVKWGWAFRFQWLIQTL